MHLLIKFDGKVGHERFDQVEALLPLTFDKVAVKLEHRDIVMDLSDAVRFWINVYNVKSPMGQYKYKSFATVALILLAIPTSNADCERVFSHVRKKQLISDGRCLKLQYLL